MSGKLQGKIAVITGATSGIGYETSLLFAKEGATVVICGTNQERLDSTVKNIQEQGGNVLGLIVDLRRAEDINNLIDKAVSINGTIDILVNSAGIMDNFSPLADCTDDEWNNVFDTNINGTMRVLRKTIPYMLDKKQGTIINISSLCGLQGTRGGAAYTSSKWALIGLSKNITGMYASEGIKCNTICPGGVKTRFASNSVPNEFGQKKIMAGATTSIRMGTPDEIASIALFLATDESSLMNGAVITADAGWSAY